MSKNSNAPKSLKILAGVMDEKNLVLYKTDGTTHIISAKDYKIDKVLEQVIKAVALGEIPFEINLESFSNHIQYASVNPDIEFYIVEDVVGNNLYNNAKVTAADIRKTGKPLELDLPEGHTIVSLVKGKAIPGMEVLDQQFRRANETNSIGIYNFLVRMASVIDQRGHSMKDLLKFMAKLDLPIADDGCVIAYKALCSTEKEGVFVDAYTRRVTQKVGSYVCMAEKLVDPNRLKDCSNGLHVASRGYLKSGFDGCDVLVMLKIPPENFITVPEYDPSKVRVMGYHILLQASEKARDLLFDGKLITKDREASKALADAISGNHTEITEIVEIRGHKGRDIKITPTSVAFTKKKNTKKTSKKKAPALAKSLDEDLGTKATPKSVKASVKAVRKATKKPVKSKSGEKPTDHQAAALRALESGTSKAEVARAFNTSTRTLGRWVDKFGSQKAKKSASKKKKYDGATPEQLKAFGALEQGKSKSEVAKLVGISPRSLGRWIDKFNFKTS